MDDYSRPSFLSFSGRLRRRDYWVRGLCVAVPISVLNSGLVGSGDPELAAVGVLVLGAGTLALLPSAVQRLHDLDRSGHFLWLSLVPVANLLLGLFLLFASGKRGANRYGPDPKRRQSREEPLVEAASSPPPQRVAEAAPASPPATGRTATAAAPPRAREPLPTEAPSPVASHDRPADSEPTKPVTEPKRVEKKVAPKPLPQAPRVTYVPERAKSQRDAYPKYVLPVRGAPVQPPRRGRSGRRGYTEEDFAAQLTTHFGGQFQILTDVSFAVANGTRSYEPDAVLHLPEHHLYVDIEVDEPYNGFTRVATHCEGDDDLRDEVFVSRGWVVVRFPEVLVHRQPAACCRFVADLLAAIVPGYTVPTSLSGVVPPERVELWDVLQSQKWSREKYREGYLGIDRFGASAEDEVTFTDQLTEQEQAVALQAQLPFGEPGVNGASGGGGTEGKRSKAGPDAPSPAWLLANEHPRDRHLTFDPEEHRYYIRGNPSTISVTTLIERHFPVFDSRRVASKVVVKPGSEYFGRDVEDVVRQWGENGEQAAVEGQRLHEEIESHLNGAHVPSAVPEFAYFLQFLEDHPDLAPYRSEWRIYDERLMVAGTVDAVFEREDGAFVLYDWKRTKQLRTENAWESGLGALSRLPHANFYHYALQQNVYAEILRQRYDVEVAEMNLLVLHPRHGAYQVHNVPQMPVEARAVMGV